MAPGRAISPVPLFDYSVVPGDLESSGRSWGVAQSRGLVVRRVILGITFRPILE